jgi:glycosyltransferase involved in cell wall biosynthesis
LIRRLTQRARYRGGDYLFVSGPGGDGRRYRGDHQAEQLRLAGATADVAYHAELDVARLAGRYATIVLYRVSWDEKVEALLAAPRGSTVLADVDDLVFDVEHAEEIRAVAALPAAERRAYVDGIARLARTLQEVDGVVVSTDPLREHAGVLNDRVAVTYNAVGEFMVNVAAAAAVRARTPSDDVVVAYLSGTPTHDVDFAEAAQAVLGVLTERPAVRFWAVGFLTLDSRFNGFGERVRRLPAVPFRELLELLTHVDVNLAPLERDNAFTDAKSCLKYLEAGLFAVPTIASPRPDFARAIRDGENGLLADDVHAWRDALGRLLDSPDLRRDLGMSARADVLARHTTAARAAEAAAVLHALVN